MILFNQKIGQKFVHGWEDILSTQFMDCFMVDILSFCSPIAYLSPRLKAKVDIGQRLLIPQTHQEAMLTVREVGFAETQQIRNLFGW